MSTDRDTTRIVRSWLEEGATALPDRVLDAVLDQVPATSQRRSWWPAWRFARDEQRLEARDRGRRRRGRRRRRDQPAAETGRDRRTRPEPDADPDAAPSPTPSPDRELRRRSFAPGTTYAITDPCCVGSSRMIFTMPATGWYAPFELVAHRQACHWAGRIPSTSMSPRISSTTSTPVAAIGAGLSSFHPSDRRSTTLRRALNAQTGPGASPPTGCDRWRLTRQEGRTVDTGRSRRATTCDSDGDFPIFGRLVIDRAATAPSPYVHGNGQHNTFYIVDVDGTRR